MKSNGNIHITNGTVTMKSTGSAGKGISADGEIVFGAVNAEGPVVDATTTGAKFLVSGHGENADYANPKAINVSETLHPIRAHLQSAVHKTEEKAWKVKMS